MKNIILALALATTLTSAANAESRINLGNMALDSTYVLQHYKNYIGYFTAPATGVVTAQANSTDVLYPYHQELDDMYTEGNAIDVTMNSYYGTRSYDFNVEQGVTYVMYANFVMTDNTEFVMTMAGEQGIHLTGTSPEEGGTFNVSNDSQISFDFDKAVSYTSSTIGVGNMTPVRISGNKTTNCIFFDAKDQVFSWLISGAAHPGDTLVVTLTGVCMTSNPEILCNGDGVVTGHFVLGPMPIYLTGEQNTSGDFLSYYTTDNEAGLVSLTFSGPVADGANAVIKYGNLDADADGEYYQETFPAQVSGNTVTADLRGKRRRAADMVVSGTDYGTIYLGFTNVHDQDGNYAFAAATGALGSYWYQYDYKEVTANVVCEFTPASGSSLNNVSNIEIWVTDEAKLSYSGIRFDCDNSAYCIVPKDQITKTQDPDDNTASILTIPVPAELQGAGNIEVSFADLQCADGNDYSSVLRAKYNSFIISRSVPVYGSTMEWLTEGQTIKLYTNMTSEVDHLSLSLRDMNADSEAEAVLLQGIATKQDNDYELTLINKVRMLQGHDYHLEAVALDAEGNQKGDDYVVWHGASKGEMFLVSWAQPAIGDTVAQIVKGDTLKFRTTMDDVIRGLKYTITDVEKNSVIASTFVDTYNEAGGYWYKKNYGNYDLLRGHHFRVTIEGYDEPRPSSNLIGTDSFLWIGGGSEPYVYSSVEVVSVSPEPGSSLMAPTDNVFTITYSAPVEIQSRSCIITGQSQTADFESITSSDDKTVWTVTVPQSVVAASTPTLMFNIYVKDSEGLTLPGNRGELGDDSYYKYTYMCLLGSPDLTVTPAAGVVNQLKDFQLLYASGIARSYTCNDPLQIISLADSTEVASISLDNLSQRGDSIMQFSLQSAITTPGNYQLVIPQEIFALGTEFEGYTSKAQQVNYTVDPSAGIHEITEDHHNVIRYNIFGQRTTSDKGILIEDGKKVMR